MTMRPAVSLTLGRLRYDVQLAEVGVSLATLPEPNHGRALLPSTVRFEAAPGETARLELTGLDLASGGTATVLTGKVHRVHRGQDGIEVQLADAGAALAAARPALSRSAGTAADVVRALIDAAGATAGDITLDLPLAGYVADQTRTAAEHIARLTALSGGVSTVDGDGRVVAAPPPDAPEVAMLYGREITTYRVTESVASATVVAVGAGPAGSAQAPDALLVGAQALPEGAPEPAAGTVWRATPLLRTPTAASTATDAHARTAATGARRLYARAVLLPTLRPGTVVQVQDLVDGAGDWLLTRVRHRVVPGRGGFTDIDAVASSAGAAGLLGALSGALGGL